MKEWQHIEEMETILKEHQEKVEELQELLTFLQRQQPEYRQLLAYYGSEKWYEDLAEDEAGNLPDSLARGVLSEDAIYNLIGDYHEVSVQMLQLVTDLLTH